MLKVTNHACSLLHDFCFSWRKHWDLYQETIYAKIINEIPWKWLHCECLPVSHPLLQQRKHSEVKCIFYATAEILSQNNFYNKRNHDLCKSQTENILFLLNCLWISSLLAMNIKQVSSTSLRYLHKSFPGIVVHVSEWEGFMNSRSVFSWLTLAHVSFTSSIISAHWDMALQCSLTYWKRHSIGLPLYLVRHFSTMYTNDICQDKWR